MDCRGKKYLMWIWNFENISDVIFSKKVLRIQKIDLSLYWLNGQYAMGLTVAKPREGTIYKSSNGLLILPSWQLLTLA